MRKTVLHFGEILWDQFSDYKRAGGSPFNVAMHLHYLGHDSRLISAVGLDDPGSELLDILQQKGADKSLIDRLEYPTGSVSVEMDEENEPSYTIHERVAWDFISFPENIVDVAPKTDAFTFATLSQRSSTNRITLQKIITTLPDTCQNFLDVNLRPPYVKQPTIEFSLKKSNYVKMNRAEWDQIRSMVNIDTEKELLKRFAISGMILTLGGDGSVYFDRDGNHYIESAVEIKPGQGDFVGVGDAFWACFIHHTLQKTPWQETLKKANQYAGWVAGQKGGIPDPNEELIDLIS